MYKKIFSLPTFFIIATMSFSQDPTMGPEERKYSKSYFLAEKYKLIEDHEAAIGKYQDCIKIKPYLLS